jgi:L-aminopeptidase/D-esterase-like protein
VTLRNLFEAAADVVQESILNSLCSADAMDGREGNRAEAFPYELLDRTGLPRSGPRSGEGSR